MGNYGTLSKKYRSHTGQRRAELAVHLVRWERCCLEWLLSELFLVCFCSFIQQVANKNAISIPGSRIPLTGQVLLSANVQKPELWLPALGSAVPAGDSISDMLCPSTFPYSLVWASQHLVYWQLSISPCSKLKLALQILVLETGSEVGAFVCHMSQHSICFI